MRWCQRRFLLTVDLHCWFMHNKNYLKIALELRCKNRISFGVESAFFVRVCTQRLYQHKVEKCSLPFDEVAAAHTALTHTRTTPHALRTHTHSPVLKSCLACEWMRECSQIFPSFLPVIPPDLLLRAEFARSCSPGGPTHAQMHTRAHMHTCTYRLKVDFKTPGTLPLQGPTFLIIREPELHLTVGHTHTPALKCRYRHTHTHKRCMHQQFVAYFKKSFSLIKLSNAHFQGFFSQLRLNCRTGGSFHNACLTATAFFF